MNLRVILVSALVLIFSTHSYAGIFIEPYVGTVSGDSDDGDGDNSDDFDISGMGYGARIGYNLLGIIAGGVYDVANPEGENQGDSAITVDYEYKNTGLFLGYSFSWVRLWYTQYLSSTLELSNTQGSPAFAAVFDGLKYSGSGWSFGLGITPLSFINVFAEIHSYKYDEAELNGTNLNLTADVESAYWLIGISFPIEFGI